MSAAPSMAASVALIGTRKRSTRMSTPCPSRIAKNLGEGNRGAGIGSSPSGSTARLTIRHSGDSPCHRTIFTGSLSSVGSPSLGLLSSQENTRRGAVPTLPGLSPAHALTRIGENIVRDYP